MEVCKIIHTQSSIFFIFPPPPLHHHKICRYLPQSRRMRDGNMAKRSLLLSLLNGDTNYQKKKLHNRSIFPSYYWSKKNHSIFSSPFTLMLVITPVFGTYHMNTNYTSLCKKNGHIIRRSLLHLKISLERVPREEIFIFSRFIWNHLTFMNKKCLLNEENGKQLPL